MNIKALLIFSILMSAFSPASHAIHGGQTSSVQSRVPFLISIRVKSSKGEFQHMCGGAIIDKNTILTAGHCADLNGLPKNSEVAIFGGATKLSEQQALARVISLNAHPDYKVFEPSFRNTFDERVTYRFSAYSDIAILKTDIITFLPGKVEPIDVNTETIPELTRVSAEFHGWGFISTGKDTDELQTATKMVVEAVREKLSIEAYRDQNVFRGVHFSGKYFDLTDFYSKSNTLVMRAESFQTVACGGDSGSPVFVMQNGRPLLIGVISATMDFRCGGHKSNVALITDASVFAEFINSSKDLYEKHR